MTHDPHVVLAHTLLTALEPADAPAIDVIFVATLPADLEGMARDGWIIVNREGSFYKQAAQDPFALCALLYHEHQHAAHNADEATAMMATAAFCVRHNAPPSLMAHISHRTTHFYRQRHLQEE